MRAIVKDGNALSVQSLARPKLQHDGDVLVQVMLAGLCRTDLYAAEGKIKTPDNLILGHEFSGVVTESYADEFKPGDRVCVNPLLSCGHCNHCQGGAQGACAHAEFIGVDRHGCFAGYIVVPASSIYPLPAAMPFLDAAYTEPVAASLAVLKANISPEQKGIIFGANRFSQLMQKIMRVYGFENIEMYDPIANACQTPDSYYDYVIETFIDSTIFTELVRAVKPGGKIILKSRQHEPLSFRMSEIIKKEPVMHVVNYGSYSEAVALLASGKIDITDLVDDVYSLDQFDTVFANSKTSESLKPFFAPWGPSVFDARPTSESQLNTKTGMNFECAESWQSIRPVAHAPIA